MDSDMRTPPTDSDPIMDAGARKRWVRLAVAAHLGLALVAFAPMVLTGKAAVWSTDNYYTHLPNLLFARDAVRSGDPGLWNPYIHCGMDFSASALNGVFYPPNWPLFLLPRDAVVFGWGVRGLIELWLVGVFAYLLFREELEDPKWALFSSIMYQMGGYALWCMTVWGGGLLLFMTAGLYVVWTLPRRPRWRSTVYLAACAAMLMIGTILPYAFSGMAAICLFYVYRYWPHSIHPLSRRGYKGTFLAGVAAGVLLAMFRLLPVALSLPESNRMLPDADARRFLVPPSTVYMGVTALAPEALGVHFSSSKPLMAGPAPTFAGHSHPFAFPYHGALAVLLGLWAIAACRDRRVLFWLALVAVASAYLLAVRPVADLIRMLTYPMYHPSVPKAILAVGLCALAGHAAMRLARQVRSITNGQIAATAVLAALGVCFLILFWAYQDRRIMPPARAGIVLAALWAGVGVLIGSRSRRLLKWFVALTALAAVSAGVWVVCNWGGYVTGMLKTDPRGLFQLSMANIAASALAMLWCVAVAAAGFRRSGSMRRDTVIVLAAVPAVASVACLTWPVEPPMGNSPLPVVAALGIARFALASAVFVVLVLLARRRPGLRSGLFVVLAALLLVDLVPFHRVFSHMITSPFKDLAVLYPDRNDRLGFEDRLPAPSNLLTNPSLRMDGAGGPPSPWRLGANRAGGPIMEVRPADRGPGEGPAIALSHDSLESSHLFQTARTDAPVNGRTFACGAWVRASRPNVVRLLLTDSVSGAQSPCHSGSGRWEWLAATHKGTSADRWVRLHISMVRPGRADVCRAALGEGHFIRPPAGPRGAETPPGPVYEHLNLADYRVSQPHQVLGLHSRELQTNLPAVYGMRTYGGVDAMISRRHMELIAHFVPDAFRRPGGRGGIAPDLAHPRLLDLTGCRYDLSVHAGRIRKTALSRLMLFEGFNVIGNDAEALDRLKSPEFAPNRGVILSAEPGLTPPAAPAAAKGLSYRAVLSGHIEVPVQAARGGLVLFNDSYHPDWQAEVDGKAAKVLRANYKFMAVPVDAGDSTVVFRFRPRRFFLGLKLTALGAALLLSAAGLGYVRGRKDRPRRTSGRDTGSQSG